MKKMLMEKILNMLLSKLKKEMDAEYFNWIKERIEYIDPSSFEKDVYPEFVQPSSDIEIKECFNNAIRVLGRDRTARYIEGFFVPENTLIAMPHAWNKKDDYYIDVTAEKFDIDVFGYFKVIELDVKQIYLMIDELATCGDTGKTAMSIYYERNVMEKC